MVVSQLHESSVTAVHVILRVSRKYPGSRSPALRRRNPGINEAVAEKLSARVQAVRQWYQGSEKASSKQIPRIKESEEDNVHFLNIYFARSAS